MSHGLAYDSPALQALAEAPKVALGSWPTPIEARDLPGGWRILVKRDDLSGHGRGGAKARKIDHLIGYMKAQGYDTLQAVAGNVTNVIFDILPVLEEHGIDHHLYIIDDPPMRPEDRPKIFEGVEEQIILLGPSRLGLWWKAIGDRRRLKREGKRPLTVLPGIAHPASIAGNAWGFVEMVQQRHEAGLPLPEAVYITAATGSTIAGFLLAERVLRDAGMPPIEIVGVQVYPGPIRQFTWLLLQWTRRHLGIRAHIPYRDVLLDDSQLHGGFAHFPASIAETCEDLEGEFGLAIDPIFGGKSWQAMLSSLRFRDPQAPRPLLYWHCGYTPEWKLLRQRIGRWHFATKNSTPT